MGAPSPNSGSRDSKVKFGPIEGNGTEANRSDKYGCADKEKFEVAPERVPGPIPYATPAQDAASMSTETEAVGLGTRFAEMELTAPLVMLTLDRVCDSPSAKSEKVPQGVG